MTTENSKFFSGNDNLSGKKRTFIKQLRDTSGDYLKTSVFNNDTDCISQKSDLLAILASESFIVKDLRSKTAYLDYSHDCHSTIHRGPR